MKGVWDGTTVDDFDTPITTGLTWEGCNSFSSYTPAPTPSGSQVEAKGCAGSCPGFDFLRNGYNLDYATEVGSHQAYQAPCIGAAL